MQAHACMQVPDQATSAGEPLQACRAKPLQRAHTVPRQPHSMANGQQEPLLLVSYGAPVSCGAPGSEPRRLCPVLPRPEARRMYGRIYLLFASALVLGLAAYLLMQSSALLHAAEVASQSLWLPGSDMCAAHAAKAKALEANLFGCAPPCCPSACLLFLI